MSSPEELTERTSESGGSGFSFLASPAQDGGGDTGTVEEETPSSFSFMSPAAAITAADEEVSSPPIMSSGFSFISPTPPANDGADSLLGLSPYSMTQDIKLEKVATSKVVKKKKRATKIGFARDEEEGDAEGEDPAKAASSAAESSSNPAPPSYIAEAPPVAAPYAPIAIQPSAAATSPSPPPPPANPPPPLPTLKETHLPERVAHRAESPAPAPATAEKTVQKEPSRAPSSSSADVKVSVVAPASGDGYDRNDLYHRLDSLTSDLSRSFKEASEASCKRYLELLSQLKLLRADADREELRVGECKARLSELEAEQHTLAEQEEFEQAEALNASTDRLRSEIQRLSASHDKLRAAIGASESELKCCKDSQFVSLQDVMSKLLRSKDKQQKDLSSTVRESSQQLQIEEAKLKAEEERVSLEMRLVEREEESLSDESKATYDAINSQCGDTQQVKEQLDIQLAGVLVEIEELELRLASKRAEERRLKLDVAGVDAKIGEVRRKYERQLARIADRIKAIEKNKAECASERLSFTRERDAHDAKAKAVAHLVDKVENWSLYVDYELVNAHALLGSLEKTSEQSASGKAFEGDAGRLRATLSAAEALYKSACNDRREASSSLEAITAEGADIEDRLPKVEAEKKAHAASKRFKEAATAASTIKTLSSRKEQIAEEIATLNDRIPACAEAVSSSSQARDSAAAALRDALREEEIARFSQLLAQAREIRRARGEILGSQVGFREIRDSFVAILDTRLVGIVEEATDIKREYQLEDSLDLEEGPAAEPAEEPIAETEPETETEPSTEADEESAAATHAPAAVEEEEEEGRAREEEERQTQLEAARALRSGLQQLVVRIDEATEAENYELCAELDEEVSEKQVALQALLLCLGLAEDATDF